MTKTAYIGLIILAALVGLFVGYCIWIPDWHIPYLFKYEILKDTLTIVLTVSAVVIAAIGFAIYLISSERLKRGAAEAARLQTQKGSIRLFVHTGFVFWESFDSVGGNEILYVEVAIGLTKSALLFFTQLPDSKTKTTEGDRLLCKIKNNLAYYYALRKKPEDKDLAMEYTRYIYERTSKYLEERDNWLDTCEFVRQQFKS